jgi:cytochrome c556
MKKNKLFLSFSVILFCGSILFACQSQKNAIRYPNQSSELALLMRQMWDDTDKIKQQLIAKKGFEDVRTSFAKIKTATPTEEGKTASPAYQAMSDMFLARLDKIYQTQQSDEELLKNYNALVQSCLQCHQSQCPGPMVRIEKLFIK